MSRLFLKMLGSGSTKSRPPLYVNHRKLLELEILLLQQFRDCLLCDVVKLACQGIFSLALKIVLHVIEGIHDARQVGQVIERQTTRHLAASVIHDDKAFFTCVFHGGVFVCVLLKKTVFCSCLQFSIDFFQFDLKVKTLGNFNGRMHCAFC